MQDGSPDNPNETAEPEALFVGFPLHRVIPLIGRRVTVCVQTWHDRSETIVGTLAEVTRGDVWLHITDCERGTWEVDINGSRTISARMISYIDAVEPREPSKNGIIIASER